MNSFMISMQPFWLRLNLPSVCASLPRSSVAVSYTHLDVYKRQRWTIASFPADLTVSTMSLMVTMSPYKIKIMRLSLVRHLERLSLIHI